MLGTTISMFKISPFKIFFLWILDISNSGITIATPWLMGLAIDGLFNGRFEWLVCFIGMKLSQVFLGALSYYIDTRVYSNMIEKFCNRYYKTGIDKGVSISAVQARLQYIEDFSFFLENGVIAIIETLCGIVVSFVYIWKSTTSDVLSISIIVFLFTLIVSISINKKILKVHEAEKRLREKEHNILRKKRPAKYAKYIHNILEFGIKKSDKESLAYLITAFLHVCLLGYSLYAIVSTGQVLPGAIYAVMTYLEDLYNNTLEIPDHLLYIDDLRDSASKLDLS